MRDSRRMTGLALGLMLLGVSTGCARRPPLEYARARAAAERAYAAGRYEEAATNWLHAAENARAGRDATEARYRAAASWERAGRRGEAAALYDELTRDPGTDRSARAAFELAKLKIEAGDADTGNKMLDDALRRYPGSGVARRALQRRLLHLSDEGGPIAALDYLDRMEPVLRQTALAELVSYERARQLELAGSKESARDAFLSVARRFPYPFGAFWDDALYHAAELDLELGRPHAAIGHLERMLSNREPKPTLGSLERPRFGPARFLIAEIYRDQLGDAQAARRTFLLVVSEHPTSPLRDDALWQAALIARSEGDAQAACRDLGRLVREMPDSRYVPCAHVVCSQLPRTDRRCRSYITAEIPEIR